MLPSPSTSYATVAFAAGTVIVSYVNVIFIRSVLSYRGSSLDNRKKGAAEPSKLRFDLGSLAFSCLPYTALVNVIFIRSVLSSPV